MMEVRTRGLGGGLAIGFGVLGLAGGPALANDSALQWGGSPRPLAGHPTVSMKSELVRISVGDRDTTVDCRFVFVNHGPACKVRVGFPDQGRGAGDPDEEGRQKKPEGTFESFDSWVNGVKVKTSVIRAAHEGNFWHVKTVNFPANSIVSVHDKYRVQISSSVGYRTPYSSRSTTYILHTGASWHGNIGQSVVEITFEKGVETPIALHALKRPGRDRDPNFATERSNNPHAVYYAGPSTPAVQGNTIRFVRKDWKPSASDDIDVFFDLHPMKVGNG